MRFRILKSDVHNKGIKFKFYIGRDCFLTPYLKTQQFSFFRDSCNPNNKVKYNLIVQKIFCWLWFRVSFTLESISAQLVNEIPLVEKLFNMLPPKINVVGKIYKLNFVKEEMVKISYIYENENLFDEVVSYDLKNALEIFIDRLRDTDNIRFMKNDYKKIFEEHFKIKVPQERKFEPYYE